MLSNATFPSSLPDLIYIIEILNESIHNYPQIYSPNPRRRRVRCYWSYRASNCISCVSCSSGDCKLIIYLFSLEGGGSLKSFQNRYRLKTLVYRSLNNVTSIMESWLYVFVLLWSYFNFKMVCVFTLILECFSRPTCFWVYCAATSLQCTSIK